MVGSKSVRPHLNVLGKVKLAQDEETFNKRRFESYNRHASMYKLHYGDEKINVLPGTHAKNEQNKTPLIGDKFPKLMKELNDSHSPIPAYVRFQSQQPSRCLLREDLKQVKKDHFKINYNRELQRPKHMMQTIISKKLDRVDSNAFFELKYFLTDAHKDKVNEAPNDPLRKEFKRMSTKVLTHVKSKGYGTKLDTYDDAKTIPNDLDLNQL
jgi:hypothetical protein